MDFVMNRGVEVWILAARPKTLVAGASPVIIAMGLAIKDGVFNWYLSLICLLIAVFFQIVSNFVNDYFDYKKGSDTPERLGPQRAVAEGWVTPKQMVLASFIVLSVAFALGVLLMWLVDWRLLFVGIAVAVFAIAYSGGKYPLSYIGLGDVCVLLFYGVVPVMFTYFVQSNAFTADALMCGLAIGLVSTTILVANNYRDYELDKIAGKKTTIVIFGKNFGEYFYLANGIIAVVLCQYFWSKGLVAVALLPLFYVAIHIVTWRQMIQIGEGRALISILGKTARNVLLFSLLLFVGFVIHNT